MLRGANRLTGHAPKLKPKSTLDLDSDSSIIKSPSKFGQAGKKVMAMNVLKKKSFDQYSNINHKSDNDLIVTLNDRYNIPKRLDYETREQRQLREALRKDERKDYIDINNCVRKDDDDIVRYVKIMSMIVRDSDEFKSAVNTATLIHIFAMLIYADFVNDKVDPPSPILKISYEIIRIIVASIYLIEMAIKWYSGFKIYWYDNMNRIEFIAIAPTIILVYVEQSAFEYLEFLIILRLLKFLKSFVNQNVQRSKTALEEYFSGLSLVMDTILRSLVDLYRTVFLLIIFMILWSVAAVTMLGRYSENFDSIWISIWSFWVITTQDGLKDIFVSTKQSILPMDVSLYPDSSDRETAFLLLTVLFIVAIIIGSFMFSNLLIAIVAANLDNSLKTEKIIKEEMEKSETIFEKFQKKEKEKEKDENVDAVNQDNLGRRSTVRKETAVFNDDDDLFLSDEDTAGIVHILPLPEVKKQHVIKAQLNINHEEMKSVSVERIEDYFTMLHAMEENLVEYNRLRIELDGIISTVYKLNESPENHELAMEILGVKEEYRTSRFDDMMGDENDTYM